MATQKITKQVVEALSPGSTIWDAVVRGFGVRRQRRDAVYLFKYSIQNQQRLVTIGRHGGPWTADAARKEAERLRGSIRDGKDPAAERDQSRVEPTLGDVLDRYLREHVATRNKPSTAAEVRRHVEQSIKPTLGRHRISKLTRRDIKAWHSTFADRPYSGNRALAYLSKALNLAHKEWELRSDNPAVGVSAFREARRERFLSDGELSLIGVALAAMEADSAIMPGAARCIRLLAMTGMRLGEVLGLRWDWIDYSEGCIRLPDAKAGARAVPLGGPVLAYLGSLERIGAFVCYGIDGDAPIGAKTFRRAWMEITKRAPLVNARPHDFRHTVGTFAAQTGANGFQVRDILGHKTLAMTGKYVERSVGPLRKTVEQVTSRVAAAMGDGINQSSAEILPLKRKLHTT